MFPNGRNNRRQSEESWFVGGDLGENTGNSGGTLGNFGEFEHPRETPDPLAFTREKTDGSSLQTLTNPERHHRHQNQQQRQQQRQQQQQQRQPHRRRTRSSCSSEESKSSCWRRKPTISCKVLGFIFVTCIAASLAIPLGLFYAGPNDLSKKENYDRHNAELAAKNAKNVDLDPVVVVVGTSTSASTSTSTGTGTGTLTAVLPSSTPIVVKFKNDIYNISTWKDTTGFNTTFTDATVGGLPIMGLFTNYNNSARPNKYVPVLSKPFDYGNRPIRGVNLGGWLVLEPFLTPSFFEAYDPRLKIVDEHSLIQHVNKTLGPNAVKELLETHYATFINETTFKEIAEAGLDHVRIPYGYWAVKVWPGDGFLGQVSWRYLLRGIEWARKYGLRVNLDLHSVPGGQNGWNHSGRQDVVEWLNGPKGEMYGNRTLEIHQQLATFFSQDRYKDIVTMYGLVNEPRMFSLNATVVNEWTRTAYNIVQKAGFKGTIIYGDGFLGVDSWQGVFPTSDFPNLMLDVHEYTIFDDGLLQMPHAAKINFVCNEWKAQLIRSSSNVTGHGMTFVGEWSQADTDCTPMLNNVGTGARWDGTYMPPGSDPEEFDKASPHRRCPGNGPDCSCEIPASGDISLYPDAYKSFLRDFAEAQMHVFENYGRGFMYWNWDCETFNATQWSYRKSWKLGLMPKVAYERTFDCSEFKDYGIMGLPESY